MNFANLRPIAAVCLLGLTALNAGAITLGAGRGNALIGRPLDWSIPVRLDSADDANALCAEADVLFADTRLEPSRVNIRTTPGPDKNQVLLRVTTQSVVDEPVVTIVLRVGCAVKNIRRVVLLADLPTDVAEQPFPVAPPLAGGTPDAAAASPPRSASTAPIRGGAGSSGAGSGGRPESAARSAAPRVRGVPASPTQRATAGAGSGRSAATGGLAQSLRLGQSAAAPAGGPRLQLDSPELLAEITPTLRAATQLQGVPLENEPRRAEFAALWRALNLQPDEVARDAQRLSELQNETRSLRDTAVRSQTELGATRQQLKEAEDARYRNPVVYALLALLIAAIAAAFYMRQRMVHGANRSAWWNDHRPAEQEPEEKAARFQTDSVRDDWSADSEPSPRARVVAGTPPQSSRAASPPSRPPDSSFLPSTLATTTSRGVNVNELFDIAQQADFFVSLGQHDHAVDVLRNHIRENPQTSPLPYLDLFKLHHDLGQRDEYDALRAEFSRIFNAQLPLFDAFREGGDGLEVYEDTLSRIQSLWNTSAVLDAIEESIFRKPGESTESFGLEAYRELLLLYSIAHELVESDSGEASDARAESPEWPAFADSMPLRAAAPIRVRVPEVFLPTSPQAVSASIPAGGGNYVPLRSAAAGSARTRQGVGLDIDLSNPLIGRRSDEGTTPSVAASQKGYGANSNAGSGWLEFDLGKLEDDLPSQNIPRKPPSR